MISKSKRANSIKRTIRILTLVWVSILLIGVPAFAERMDSVDIYSAEVAYKAQYQAYTEAASGDDAVICKFTIENPTADHTGTLCRIVLPESQNVYLYMDDGDLAVMRYDGSEYKKFSVAYQLKSGLTYTLCVFQDGLAFFDGAHCYTYSGNFEGFTDVLAGWSYEANVFSTTLTKRAPAETEENDEITDQTEEASSEALSEETETEEIPQTDSHTSIWFILALLLGITSNLLALAVALVALRSSNIALRILRRSKSRSKTPSKPATAQRQKKPSVPPKSQKKQPKFPSHASTRTGRSPTPAASCTQSKKQTSPPTQPAAPKQSLPPMQPFDLYADNSWRTLSSQFVPVCYGDQSRGYCTFRHGTSVNTDLFILLGDDVWLNPVRFHPISEGGGVPISLVESAGISIAFDFCHVGTGKREAALLKDVEMVNFRPAHIVQHSNGILELVARGIIVFE